MQQADFHDHFIGPLKRMGIDYMVTGSVASILYGEPRLTNGMGLVLHLRSAKIKAFASAFPAGDYYCPPTETLKTECNRDSGGHFNLIHHASGLKADVYLFGNDPLHEWGFGRRREIEIAPGKTLWVAPIEYVILRKLEYYKEGGSGKHLTDIEGMLKVSDESIDRGYLSSQLEKRGLSKVAREISGLTKNA